MDDSPLGGFAASGTMQAQVTAKFAYAACGKPRIAKYLCASGAPECLAAD
jgi:hypothetical protein